jgi:ATP-dependent 26S proteasome regulatory subunit
MLELLNQLDGFSSDDRIKVCPFAFSDPIRAKPR